MKKYQKIIMLVAVVVLIFLTYSFLRPNGTSLYYIPLGDSVAEGMNPYGEIGYGYTDYIGDYLKDNKRLSFYTKAFTKSGYKANDLISDIENNKEIKVDGKTLNIKKALREANLVTISIGANDFLQEMQISNISDKLADPITLKKEVDVIGLKVETVIELVKKYAKGQIILLGYYNPMPRLTVVKDKIDEIILYSNNTYREIAQDYDISYVDIFELFDNNSDYLPNSFDIHPNTQGYKAISQKIIKEIK